MASLKPSQPWRLVLTTPGAPMYTKHRSKTAAYRAVEAEKARAETGMSRVVRIAVEQWNVEAQRWLRYENVWAKTASKPNTEQ